MPTLESDEEIKSEPEGTIAERIKLNPRKRKNTGTGLLTGLPILLARIKGQ